MDDTIRLDLAEHGRGGTGFKQVKVTAAQPNQLGVGKCRTEAGHHMVSQKARAAGNEYTLKHRFVRRHMGWIKLV